MKRIAILTAALILSICSFAQGQRAHINNWGAINNKNVQTYMIPRSFTTHIVSPDNISYVDISNFYIDGDIQEENPHVLRIKPNADSVYGGETFTVTIVTNRSINTFRFIVAEDENDNRQSLLITLDPKDGISFNNAELNDDDFKKLTTMALPKKRTVRNISTKAFGLEYHINNIYTAGDYIILDATVKNNTKIQYDVNEVRFRLQDTRQVKATVSQDLEIVPLYRLYNDEKTVIKGKKEYRNLYVFRKFTYPGQKQFVMEMTEKEISGRKMELSINYNQLLQADFLL